MKREKPPVPMVRKERHGYSPVSAYDAELLFSDAAGTEYDLVKRTKRSLPQLRLYWAMLGRVVKATGKWPTPEHLHSDLKIVLGYYIRTVNVFTGEERLEPDSAALDQMSADEFRGFFDRAVIELTNHLEFDPLAFMEAA
jgi:hypothetical protein